MAGSPRPPWRGTSMVVTTAARGSTVSWPGCPWWWACWKSSCCRAAPELVTLVARSCAGRARRRMPWPRDRPARTRGQQRRGPRRPPSRPSEPVGVRSSSFIMVASSEPVPSVFVGKWWPRRRAHEVDAAVRIRRISIGIEDSDRSDGGTDVRRRDRPAVHGAGDRGQHVGHECPIPVEASAGVAQQSLVLDDIVRTDLRSAARRPTGVGRIRRCDEHPAERDRDQEVGAVHESLR